MEKQVILPTKRDGAETEYIKYGEREGIIVEKGVVLSEEFLNENLEYIESVMEYYSAYPDMFLDDIAPYDSNFTFFFYQRIVLRVMMRFKDIYITAPRAFSKSFITILAMLLQCIFMPGTKRFICAPNIKQGAQIAKEKIYEIYERWPLLRKEVLGGDISDTPGNFGKDYVK